MAKTIGPQALGVCALLDAQLGQPSHRIGTDGHSNGAGQQGEGEHKGPHEMSRSDEQAEANDCLGQGLPRTCDADGLLVGNYGKSAWRICWRSALSHASPSTRAARSTTAARCSSVGANAAMACSTRAHFKS